MKELETDGKESTKCRRSTRKNKRGLKLNMILKGATVSFESGEDN